MQNPTPTRQELSSYFFDRCTPEISNKVERWFFKNGNSQEAKKLLFSLWEELEDTTSSTSPEEIQAAFEQFKARLLSSAPQENKSKKPNLFLWIQRIAAILILPLIIFSGYLFYQHQKEENIVWIEKSAGYGDIKHITLPDNTTVWLNAGSTIIYPEEFIGRFRQIFFTGEGHFSVAKNKEKPFIIKSNESSIEVLGTQFNLKIVQQRQQNRSSPSRWIGSVLLSEYDRPRNEMYPLSGRASLLQSHNPQSGKEKFYPIRLFFMERWKILFQKRNIGKYCQTVRAEFRCQHNYQKRFTQTNSLSHGICQQRNFRRHSIGHEFRRIFNNQTRW